MEPEKRNRGSCEASALNPFLTGRDRKKNSLHLDEYQDFSWQPVGKIATRIAARAISQGGRI